MKRKSQGNFTALKWAFYRWMGELSYEEIQHNEDLVNLLKVITRNINLASR